MDREGAGSSSFCQDLNPRRAVIGYHFGLDIWLPPLGFGYTNKSHFG